MKQARQLLMLALICLGSFGLAAQSYQASGVGTTIPPEGTGGGDFPETANFFTFDVDANGVIGEDVRIEGLTLSTDHTFAGDLVILLENPDGVRHLVTGGSGGGNDGYDNFTFTDDSDQTLDDIAAFPGNGALTGSSRGFSSFNVAFAGDEIEGEWQLVIYDDAGGDTGTFLGATLAFAEPLDQEPLPTNQQSVNLAAIDRINVELNDDCEALLIPEMVLTGDFDEDEDGTAVDFDAFEIVVQDENPDNGPIIDGCGEYTYMIRPVAPEFTITTGFVGPFSPESGNIDTVQTDGGSVEFTEDAITLTSEFFDGEADGDEDAGFSITFTEVGLVAFNYETNITRATEADVAVIDFEGEIVYAYPLFLDSGFENPGVDDRGRVTNFRVNPGETLSFLLVGDDADNDNVSEFTISGFAFIGGAPLPFEVVNFTQGWGTVTAKDETDPVLVSTPDDVTGLLCVDLDANNLNSLPSTVSRCYEVDADGNTVMGSMDPALRAILAPAAFDNTDEDVALVPVFSDNCASVLEVCVSDVVTEVPDEDGEVGCGATIITRTFRANEVGGCAAEYNGTVGAELVTSFTITLERPTIDQITTDAIMPVVEIESCGTADAPLTFLPDEEDFPVLSVPTADGGVREFSVASQEAACARLVTTFTNSANPTVVCENTVKFSRLYTVADWCEPTNVQTFTQFVKVGDTTGPVFSRPSGTIDADGNLDPVLTYRTNFGDECAAIVRLDGPGVGALDECDGSDVEISVAIYPEGDLTQAPFGAYDVLLNNGEAEFSEPLEVGEYAFVYTAIDQCGNRTVEQIEFQVVDGNGPTAICESGINIGLSRPAGVAVITPSQVDLGSYDDCSDGLTYEIAVSDTEEDMPSAADFGDQVIFTCDDVNTTRYVTLRVTDELENSNTCWLPVLVELKPDPNNLDRPICNAPSDITITCTQYTAQLPADILEATDEELNAAFGVATGSGTCGATVVGTFDPLSNRLNECGIGTITRVYEATDAQGGVSTNVCEQNITVVGIFDYQIQLPGNANSADCNDEFEADELLVTGGACDLPVVTSTVERIDGEDGPQCYIERITYTIINTCEYDPTAIGSTIITRDGLATDDTDPIFLNLLPGNINTDADDRLFISSSDNRQLTPGDDDDVEVLGYSTSPTRGSFTYVQDIRVTDRVSPSIATTASNPTFSGCTATVTVPFTASDDCDVLIPSAEVDPFYSQAAGFQPVDPTDIGVSVSIVAGAEEGSFVLTATDVPAGEHAVRLTATDGCGNSRSVVVPFEVLGDVAPSILCETGIIAVLTDDGLGGGSSEVWASDLVASPIIDCRGDTVTKFGIVRFGEGPATVDQIGLTVTCADFGERVVVEVYAFDDLGNEPESCVTDIEIQEGNDVNCSAGGGNFAGTIITDGGDAMGNVAVTLTGSSDMDETQLTDNNGAFNFVNLPLGGDYTLQPNYDEPVNLQQVKISDVVRISSVILGTNTFESPYDYLAADVDQSRSLNVLDMVAIQRVILGLDDIFATNEAWGFIPADVNVNDPYATAFPSVLNANDFQANILDADFVAFAYGNVTGEGRTASSIIIDDVSLLAGETTTVVLDAPQLAGFQGTFELASGLELVAASYEGEGALNLNYANEGLIAAALYGNNASLKLEVRASVDGRLSNMLSLTDAITVTEGVTTTGANGNLSLDFSGITEGELVNALGNATPNPVLDQTQISYTLAADSKVTLSIQDVQGRTVMVRNLEGTRGQNVVNLTVAELRGATGVLTYTVTAGEFSATKKLVVAAR